MTGVCVLVYKHTAENDMQENENTHSLYKSSRTEPWIFIQKNILFFVFKENNIT